LGCSYHVAKTPVIQCILPPHYVLQGTYTSCRAITEEPDRDFFTLKPNGFNDLGVSWHKIDGLIAPFDILALNIQNDSLYGFLRGELDGFSIVTYLDNKPQIFDSRELDEFERFWPGEAE
jgi:hypothetical protein